MKKGIIIASAAMLLASCCDELEITSSDVPKDLMAAFNAKYPDAKNVEWEVEKEDGKFYYEAEWKENGKKVEVHISPDGTMTSGD